MLTVELKSALFLLTQQPKAARSITIALLKLAVRWEYYPGVHDFVAVRKDITIRSYYTILCTTR